VAYHVEEFSSLKRSYHYHGARGITSNKEHIFIAAQNVIFVFDKDLKLIREIHNNLFNGLHELDWYSGSLYVTCAVTDSILALNQEGDVTKSFLLGNNPFFTSKFNLEPRTLDNRLDYRVMHRCRRLYHINNVQVTNDGVYAGFNIQGAFVKIHPFEEILIADTKLNMCHNAQYTPDREHILINDTKHYSLQVFDHNCKHLRTIDLRKLDLPIDFSQKTTFGTGHQIKAGWLRGMEFSRVDQNIVFLGLSPSSILAIDYVKGKMVDFMKLRRNIWITVHGIHNLS
jgi:hypothetical protein